MEIENEKQQALLDLIGSRYKGILALVKSSGYPHLSNITYLWDAERMVASVSTTADRVKGRIVQRDGRAALHVLGDHFWSFAVAECDATPTPAAATPGDAVCRELLPIHSQLHPVEDEEAFHEEVIAAQRMVIRLEVRRVYGLLLDQPPRPEPPAGGGARR